MKCPEGHELAEKVFCYECGTHVKPALGFTQEDVRELRDAAGEARANYGEHSEDAEGDRVYAAILAIADKIAAFLPPP